MCGRSFVRLSRLPQLLEQFFDHGIDLFDLGTPARVVDPEPGLHNTASAVHVGVRLQLQMPHAPQHLLEILVQIAPKELQVLGRDVDHHAVLVAEARQDVGQHGQNGVRLQLDLPLQHTLQQVEPKPQHTRLIQSDQLGEIRLEARPNRLEKGDQPAQFLQVQGLHLDLGRSEPLGMTGLPALGLASKTPLLTRTFRLAEHARLKGPLLLGVLLAETVRACFRLGLLPSQLLAAPFRVVQTAAQLLDSVQKLAVLVPYRLVRRGGLGNTDTDLSIGTLLFPLFQGKSSLGLHSDLDGLRQQTNRAQDPLTDTRQRARPLLPRQ